MTFPALSNNSCSNGSVPNEKVRMVLDTDTYNPKSMTRLPPGVRCSAPKS